MTTLNPLSPLPSFTLEEEPKKNEEGRKTGSQLLTQRYHLLRKSQQVGSLAPAASQLAQAGREGQLKIADSLNTVAHSQMAAQTSFATTQVNIHERTAKAQLCKVEFTQFSTSIRERRTDRLLRSIQPQAAMGLQMDRPPTDNQFTLIAANVGQNVNTIVNPSTPLPSQNSLGMQWRTSSSLSINSSTQGFPASSMTTSNQPEIPLNQTLHQNPASTSLLSLSLTSPVPPPLPVIGNARIPAPLTAIELGQMSAPSPLLAIGNTRIPGALLTPAPELMPRPVIMAPLPVPIFAANNVFGIGQQDLVIVEEHISGHNNTHTEDRHSGQDPTKLSMTHRGAVQRASPGEGIAITPQGAGLIIPSANHRTMTIIESGPSDLYPGGSQFTATVIHLEPVGGPVSGTSNSSINAAIATVITSVAAVSGVVNAGTSHQPTSAAAMIAAVPRSVSGAPDTNHIVAQEFIHGPQTQNLGYCYSVSTTLAVAAGAQVNQKEGTVQPLAITEITTTLDTNNIDCMRNPGLAIIGTGALLVGGPIVAGGTAVLGIGGLMALP